VRSRYALLPLEGIPASRLPEWTGAEARVLAAPVLGAQFVEYLLTMPKGAAGEHPSDGAIEFFFYVLTGSVTLTINKGKRQTLREGGFALLPPTADFRIVATRASTVLMLRKPYEHADGIPMFAPLIGNQDQVKPTIFCGDPGARLQLLIPDDLQYDLAMNIFTFDVGHSLPVVETHVMEHGLYFLQGKGVYYLDDT